MHLGGYLYSRVELLTSKGAEQTTVASAADCEVEADSLTAGHERKHNACRAELEVALAVIPISEENEALRICGESWSKDSTQAHANTRPQKQSQGKQARDRRAEAALPGYPYVFHSPDWACQEAACKLASTERSHCKGLRPCNA
ncbi:TPA: hypothetical protein ACH3X2_008039 [Trebouxia sp. C0005]